MIETLFLDTPAVVLFGILAGVLSIYAYLPYIRDTKAGRTHPQRASWLIWSVLSTIALLSQIHEGAGPSLFFAGVQVTCTLIIFSLSSWVDTKNRFKRTDHLIFLAAGMGLVLWYFTNSAAYALAVTISISLLGGSATVVKAYRDPESETLVTWVSSFIASGFALLAVGRMDLVLLAYPLYLVVLYGAILCAIFTGRRAARRRARQARVPVPTFSVELGTGHWPDGSEVQVDLQAANTPAPVSRLETVHTQ